MGNPPLHLSRREFCRMMAGGALAASGLGALSGCSQRINGPNLVILVLDTVRSDHLSLFGYSRPTSPRLDAFAESATVFRRHMAAAPWTVPTHASLFTGLHPFEHGAHSFMSNDPSIDNVYALAEPAVTIAEILSGAGYRTVGFVSNIAYLNSRMTLHQGFDYWKVDDLTGDRLNPFAFEWLDEAAERPFFLFMNYMDAHRPYNTTPLPDFPVKLENRDSGAVIDSLKMHVMGDREWDEDSEDLRQTMIDQYDTGVAHADAAMGALLDRLRKLGVYDNTAILILSDHGEYFGEHFLIEHSKDIYQEALWTPAVLKAPGQIEGESIDDPIGTVDLPRMMAEWMPAGLADRFQAQFPYEMGKHPLITENYYTRGFDLAHPDWGNRFKRIRTGIYDWPWKLIYSNPDEAHELYNLDQDPKELHNLIEAESERALDMMDALSDFQMASTFALSGQAPKITEKDRRAMKKTGYLN